VAESHDRGGGGGIALPRDEFAEKIRLDYSFRAFMSRPREREGKEEVNRSGDGEGRHEASVSSQRRIRWRVNRSEEEGRSDAI
jgi:hypothetical protein